MLPRLSRCSAWAGLFSFVVAATCAAGPKYGGSPAASPLSGDHAYLQDPRHPAPDYWALSSFYVPQLNEFSCSVASVAAVVNALTKAGRPLADTDKNATHESLLGAVKAARWAERVSKGGADGKVGVTLDQLAEVLAEALEQNGIKDAKVETFRVTEDNKATRAAWREVLESNESSPDDMVVVHFVQDALTHASGGPYAHISPVGAFDKDSGRVLVFDVDREYYEPYWVDASLLLKAMAVSTPSYGHGGWIRVSR